MDLYKTPGIRRGFCFKPFFYNQGDGAGGIVLKEPPYIFVSTQKKLVILSRFYAQNLGV
jgi:hypothetical protein